MLDFTKPRTLVISVLFLLILSIVVLGFSGESVSFYGINKTVGWAWELGSAIPFITILILFIFLIGYNFMWLLKMNLNKVISLFNLCFIIGSFTFISTNISVIFLLNAFLMFVVNFAIGITAKISKNKKSE